MAVHVLKEHDPTARVRFCNQIRSSVHDVKVDPNFMFFFDEACFSLPGKANSQNNRYGSTENPGLIRTLPLLYDKICVWCPMSTSREVQTVFGQDVQTVNNLLRRYTDHVRSGRRH